MLIRFPIGPGVAHGNTCIYPFIPNTLIKNLPKITFTIGAKQNGIRKYGFRTIGAANRRGSFTANITGTIDAFPTAFNCLDFIKRINIIGTIKVAPVPPNSPTKLPKFSVRA
ncbi:Uncharacterised protein [Streptococcus pneumoniae]|nr:Uncharacterised protein [Streptococcus pneumoniae]